ncbi:MAG: glutamate-1-semialdehyde 2,1-aminomutase [Oscillospiraceae bacterium]|nr:glutamate-1-semialdehyde 2,1-aminomutase [Oscillospiraceae bacterium]
MEKSRALFTRAEKVIPGGVNSPVRAFRSVGGNPRFITRAKGSRLWDADGKEYIDYVGSWGPMILGHNDERILEAVSKAACDGLSFGAPTEREVLVAELMTSMVPGLEMVRMVNSGTEAVMSAVRLARGYTGKDKVIKFAGCYHGHSDSMLVKAGSGVMTQGVPDSLGVPAAAAKDTLTAVYNDADSVEMLLRENRGQIAAVIVEPVAANMGVITPKEGFLQKLRRLCDENGALLIFDEVITGFRLCKGGAQEFYGVKADLCTYGKIIGGGMPVGAYGGRKEIMNWIAPSGQVYQAGTLSGNPVAMAAGLAQLTVLNEDPSVYERINHLGELFACGMKELIEKYRAPLTVTGVGSLRCVFFTSDTVENYEDAKKSDTALFARYFNKMLEKGFYFAPSQFEAAFFSAAHTEADIRATLAAADETFAEIMI